MSRKTTPKVAFTKPPTSFSEQVRWLQQRGLIIVSNVAKAECYLTQLSCVRSLSTRPTRLWNCNFFKTTVLPRHGEPALIQNLPDSDLHLRKIYNTMVTLGYLIDVIIGENHWKLRLIQLINHHRIDIDRMGFPADWQARPIWQ